MALVLAGCAPGLGFSPAPRGCERLFRDYDTALRVSGGGFGRPDLVLPTRVSRTAQRVREGGCLTWFGEDPRALAALQADLAAGLRGESGAPIRPVTLQLGIVPGYFSEFQARQFFGELGYRVRSRGAPGLGRRIGLGPFTTEGGLAEAAAAARRAGFPAPYVWRF
jgi:hypothetical protein